MATVVHSVTSAINLWQQLLWEVIISRVLRS